MYIPRFFSHNPLDVRMNKIEKFLLSDMCRWGDKHGTFHYRTRPNFDFSAQRRKMRGLWELLALAQELCIKIFRIVFIKKRFSSKFISPWAFYAADWRRVQMKQKLDENLSLKWKIYFLSLLHNNILCVFRRNSLPESIGREEKDIPVVDEAARENLQLLTIEMAFWTWIILRETREKHYYCHSYHTDHFISLHSLARYSFVISFIFSLFPFS